MSISVTRLVLVTIAATFFATSAHAGICVDVDLHFAGPAPSQDLSAMLEQEATAIWSPYDVDLRWGSPRCAVEDASFDVLIEDQHLRASLERPVLGSTRVELSSIDRVPIRIDAGATERTLESLTIGELSTLVGRSQVGPEEMGRAFGRILAHEIGHVLLGLPSHQHQGLMRPTFQAADMVRPPRWQYTLSPLEIARLHHRSGWIVARRNRVASSDQQNDPSGSVPR